MAGVDEANASNANSTPIWPGVGSPRVTVDTTGPAFCDRPVWSAVLGVDSGDLRGRGKDLADRDDARAADARASEWRRRSGTASFGSGSVPPSGRDALGLLGRAELDRDERRAVAFQATGVDVATGLIDDVLRPNSVSVECSDRQLDFTPQSPQASHTRSSIITLNVAGGRMPRLRSRRFSAAHC